MKKRRHFPALVILFIGLVFLIVVFFKHIPLLLFNTLMPSPLPEELFRGYVLSPIPESVENIRADQPRNFRGYRYTYRFNINRDDLDLLIHSKSLVRVWNVEYKNGDLHWDWERGSGLLGIGKHRSGVPFYDHTREPKWFRLEQWENPETYAFLKEGNRMNADTFHKNSNGLTKIRVLLYNENEAEAYYVVTRYEN
jgi:hypothetical protein